MSKFTYLNQKELNAINSIIGGADITSPSLAQTLRSVKEKQDEHNHQLIKVCPIQGTYGVFESRPYFGCIALKQGEKAVKDLLDKP